MSSEDLVKSLSKEFGSYGEKFEKAINLVQAGCVKQHLFRPSNRELWTVVGKEGERWVDDSQPYCSCRHFYYKVLRGRDETCYHLLALRMAKKVEVYDQILLDDEEYQTFLKYILKEATKPLRRKRLS